MHGCMDAWVACTVQCRHNSVWMYFPHVELLFLLFSYQGASAAESRMIYSGCFPLVVLGVCALVSGEAEAKVVRTVVVIIEVCRTYMMYTTEYHNLLFFFYMTCVL